MDRPTLPQAVAAVAVFVRDRVIGSARQAAMVIVGAAASFPPTSESRARLIRQMHASGLLTDEHVRRARELREAETDASGAPR